MRQRIQQVRALLGLSVGTRIFFYSVLTGAVAGTAAVGFTALLEAARYLLIERFSGYAQWQPPGEVRFDFSFLGLPAHDERLWLLLLLPALGGLVSGWIAWRFAPETRGPGTGAVIDAFHNHRGQMRGVVAPVKAVTTIVTLASGGSAGKEGPVMQIGASLGSWLSERLGLSATHRRILLLAGCAGGLGAIFRAPLGGAITCVEVLYREDFESDALIPCVTSSIVAYSIYTAVYGFGHIFDFPDVLLTDVRELGVYLVLGVACALGGWLYTRVFFGLRHHLFRRLPLPVWVVPGIGGLFVGVLAAIDLRVLGGGFGVIQSVVDGGIAVPVLLLLACLKILATACTVGSGGSGGVFGPSLFIGAMIGGIVGTIGHQVMPQIVQVPAAYVVVGMGSFLAGVANTPLAALIIVTEMTGSYHLLPALMLVSAFAFLFLRKVSIYEDQVQNKFHSPAHLKDFTVDVLKNLRVGEVYERLENTQAAIVTNETAFFSLNALSRKLGHLHFVVTDTDGQLRGMIRLDDLDLPDDDVLRRLILVEDMLVESVEAVRTDDDLHTALEKLLSSGFDKLPVLDGFDEDERMLGCLEYSDVLRLYDEETARLERLD
jgi:CIC family chloride channel protein